MSAKQHITYSALMNGYFAARDYFSGAATGAVSGAKFAYNMVKDTSVSLAKNAIKGLINAYVPAAKPITHVATEVAAHGIAGLADGNNVGTCMLKGGTCAAITLTAGPVAGFAAGIAMDNASEIYNAVQEATNGVLNAYNNAKYHNEYEVLKYRKHFGPSIQCDSLKDSTLGDSFVLMSKLN